MPRFLFGQRYWGEMSSVKMRELLVLAQQLPWRESLRRLLPNESVTQHLLSPIRADFLHAMPWPLIRDVLDVGAGMGFMACDMARYASTVVALEAVPERAEFIQIRARQDGLQVFPVIGSAMDIPFGPESFDLITLNGVFEYIGLWGDGDPSVVQEKFLRSVLRLLRPGGYLYIGIEARISLSILLGARDHSGLAFTSLMPRWLADVYCRARARPNYGAEDVTGRYRTYTYTPPQYERILRKAGFQHVSVNGVYDGYNRQIVIFDLRDARGRRAILERIDPPSSLAGKVRRALEGNSIICRNFEQEVILFARKDAAGPETAGMPWTEIDSQGRTVVQVNLASKIFGIVCEAGIPQEVLEIEKKGREEVAQRLNAAYEILRRLQNIRIGTAPPMHWPEPLGRISISGRSYRRYAYIHGDSISSLLKPVRYAEYKVLPIVTRAISCYVSLCSWMSEHLSAGENAHDWATFEQQIELATMGNDTRNEIRGAITKAKSRNWKMSVIHGDFTAGNVIVRPNGDLVLLDWENFTPAFPVGAELVRFQQDILMDSERLPRQPRERLTRKLDHVVRSTLEMCGYHLDDYRDLHSLYVGHQIVALGGEENVYPRLIQAFKEGAVRLSMNL